MRALVLQDKNSTPTILEMPAPVAADGEVVVSVVAASLNHRDVWIQKGLYPGLRYPVVPGSDGAGLLDGREVIIQPGVDWGDSALAQSVDYKILGLPANGTFAEKVVVRQSQIYDKPGHLSFEAAAALPLAGLTAFRTLFTRCRAQVGDKVLVTGAGGGVAMFCVQFAIKAGLEVYVTSGSDDKIAKSKELGATGGANYRFSGWADALKKLAGGFDIIIDGAGGAGFQDLMKLANPGARIGVYGGTLGAVPSFSPQLLFWKQLSILGSTMGNDNDFAAMLSFVEKHKIEPVVDIVYPFSEASTAFRRMEAGGQFGKIVLKVN